MMINFFYTLMIILIISAYACLISAKNTITSLLLFIAIYLIAAINFLLVGAEFLALTLIIVYVGAISILSLFVIMMLNLRLVEVYNTYSIYIPITYIIALLFVCEIIYFAHSTTAQNICINYSQSHYNDWNYLVVGKTNINVLAEVLYNHYPHLLWFAGLILSVAMVGCIALTIDFPYHTSEKIAKSIYINTKELKTNINFYGTA